MLKVVCLNAGHDTTRTSFFLKESIVHFWVWVYHETLLPGLRKEFVLTLRKEQFFGLCLNVGGNLSQVSFGDIFSIIRFFVIIKFIVREVLLVIGVFGQRNLDVCIQV